MKKISLESILGISTLTAELETDPNRGVDIYYKDYPEGDVHYGGYSKPAVKQFVRELAEALDLTLEEPTPEVEPIVLPKDVYDEVERFMKYIYSDENTVEIKRRADAKLWTNCRSDSGGHLATYIANKAGASIDIARVFMKELPYECEESKWVLKSLNENYLSKACMNPTGGWSLEFTHVIENAIKFPSHSQAADFAETLSYMASLRAKEV